MSSNRFLAVAIAALTLGAAISLGASQADANTKGGGAGHSPPSAPSPGPHHASGYGNPNSGYGAYKAHHFEKCYWLPTMSNGSLSGLAQKCIWVNK